ncbi:hypothetical protein ABI_47640 [Asticcacaulis biprosthecium C19]|uniref:Putative Flp pilus-assembly TadG-like N-terminal domain-containing protein n=1 Tax=Asticcacaulis biprosthecium C19 TaxID=715226 RepID=F4QUB7_9CAUL|nr:Tad domain-containing protein [Asticcacaulis biprosthecium]EGF89417.1 hypothetical protein ABI_47640 [Asticcacaulis biprosthecium C19]
MRRQFVQWAHCQGGNVAVISALCAAPLLYVITATIDHSAMVKDRFSLQAAADAGALMGAAKLALGSDELVFGAAEAAAHQQIGDLRNPVTFEVVVDRSTGAVTVTGRSQHAPLIGFMSDGPTPISARATAEGLLKTPLCILQIGSSEMKIDDQATVRAGGCLVHSNKDVTVASGAFLQAAQTQAVGAVRGPVSPQGHNGAMTIEDPFLSMNLTPPTDCNGKTAKIKIVTGAVLTLPAGVHCEHFKIEKNATLILGQGDHWFMDHLESKDNATIRGDDVVLIFGSDKSVKFNDTSSVQITARKTGVFAGFLLATTRQNDEKFVIASNNVSELLGTIYIPNAELEVETAGQVAEDSAWSIIVAKTITLKKNPVMVINTRYSGSGVPVPAGVGPAGTPRLTR